jgi:peptidoglycan/xylan/chitin deacetylase (PgdA/CDA1 family)
VVGGDRHHNSPVITDSLPGPRLPGDAVPGERGLERLLLPVDAPQLDTAPGHGDPAWLTSGDWRLLARPRPLVPSGEELARFALENGETLVAFRDEDGTVRVPFDLDEAYGFYVGERWRDHMHLAALSAGQLGLYYRIKRLFPRAWLLSARRLFMRWTGLPDFPRWPLDESVVHLLAFYALCLLAASGQSELEFVWFWPAAYRAALMLTHDVESAEGLRLAVEIADLEEARGFRSSFNIVGRQYPIDHGIVRDLRERGFEIGLHGIYHDRSLFASREEFERQLPQLAEAARELNAHGFRSPATHRVVDWLAELPVEYDCTMFHSDPYEPQPGGCCTLWPFRIGSLLELPYTLPQDHTLFTLLRQRSVETWLRQVDAIEARFGLVHFLSHPDPGYLGDPDKRGHYVELLDALAERTTLWHALPREIAAWWSQRELAGEGAPDARLGTIRRDGDRARLEPPV